jgi:cysteine-rich repeat protein
VIDPQIRKWRQHARRGRILRAAFSALAAAYLTLAADGSAAWQASGRFQYTDRLYDLSAYTGTATMPVREADVQVYDLNSQATLGTAATDASGDFSITIGDPTLRDVGVRALSSTNQTPSLYFDVVDDGNSNAIYVYHDPAADVPAHTVDDIDFGTLTMPLATGDVGSTDWSSQVFNLFDMGVLIADWIASVDGARPTAGYRLGWNPTNERSGSWYDIGNNLIRVADDDGYDDPNILHELGHYVDDEFSYSTSPSGAHFIGDNDQDPRLAWVEGLATFFSSATLEQAGRPRPDLYIDHDGFDVGGGGGFGYTVETGAAGASGGATSELVVTTALWDIIDRASSDDGTPGVDDDPMSDPHANIWTVLEAFGVSPPAATQMADFWETWFSEGLNAMTDMQAIFTAAQIDFVPDGQEPNDTPPAATPLMVNGAYLKNTFYGTGADPAGDEDWFVFSAVAGTYYRISVNGANGAIFGRPDPEIFLLDSGLSVLAYNDGPNDLQLNDQSSSFAQDMAETAPSILWRAPATGSHFIYARHASHRRNLDGRYGTYQIRVSSVASPSPSISEVAAQTMLPGQSYQALIIGSDFSRDITVTAQDPGIVTSGVAWMGPTALVATLSVASSGVADGAYSLLLANPAAGSSLFPAALEVSSNAAPPIAINEVELGTDRVEIKNLGSTSATLTGWQISSYRPGGFAASVYTFPSFSLAAGERVVVSETGGVDTATDLYDQGNIVNWPWLPKLGGAVSLIDASGRNVDYVRFVESPVDDHEAPLGAGGAWLHPDIHSPPSGLAVARAESAALLRTHRGLSWAKLTMPIGALGKENATDAFEDNDSPRRAQLHASTSSLPDLAISPRTSGEDEDWFSFPIAAGEEVRLDVFFEHLAGDLDMALYAPGNETTALLVSATANDDESILLTSAMSTANGAGVYRLRIHGVLGATNAYALEANQTECGDGVLDVSEQCDDGNLTDGDCCSVICQLESEGSSCEDGDACTLPGLCDAVGDCLGGAPVSCDDAIACTTDSCDLVLGCVNANNASACDDGDACTDLDACSGGACVAGGPLDCDDANLCTDDGCDSGLGCTHANNTLTCSDADACSTDETCSAGICVAADTLDCDDSDACTADSCDQVSGCVNTPIVNCPANVPLGSNGFGALLATLLLTAGFLLLGRRQGAPARVTSSGADHWGPKS